MRQFLPVFGNLSILSCLDISGYYQYESIYLPVFFFLRSCNVDFQFGVEVKNIEMTQRYNQRAITGLHIIQEGLESHKSLGRDDIVIANLGSTISGSAIGTNDTPPLWESMAADDMLDQNWSTWLDLGNQLRDFGNPYNFCTRQSESMLESFTITTEDIRFFDTLKVQSQCTSEAGAFILFENSYWGIKLCIPPQPVFATQSRHVRVLWGFAHSPGFKGNYVNKPMLHCSGLDIMTELLGHLDLPYGAAMSRTVTIPRVMPRMSALLLTRTPSDRPEILPQSVSNVGLVGHFVEVPRHTCVDIGYEIRTAQTAVSRLMGYDAPTPIDPSASTISTICKVLFRR